MQERDTTDCQRRPERVESHRFHLHALACRIPFAKANRVARLPTDVHQRVNLTDALIAATAVEHRLAVVTRTTTTIASRIPTDHPCE